MTTYADALLTMMRTLETKIDKLDGRLAKMTRDISALKNQQPDPLQQPVPDSPEPGSREEVIWIRLEMDYNIDRYIPGRKVKYIDDKQARELFELAQPDRIYYRQFADETRFYIRVVYALLSKTWVTLSWLRGKGWALTTNGKKTLHSHRLLQPANYAKVFEDHRFPQWARDDFLVGGKDG